jgi:diguanylate cyclase (GGDEF)-like protein
VLDAPGGALEVQLAVGEGAEQLLGRRVLPGEGLVGWVARAGQAILVDDVRADARFSERVDPAPREGRRSFLAAPLRSVAGAQGVIALVAREEEPFAPDDLRTLCGLSDYAAIALSNARNHERVRELTLVDDHTSLFNSRHLRRTLEVEVARSERYRRVLSLLFFDLDEFKHVNDVHGHQAGSDLLREVGEVMRGVLRSLDVPVRYGGDEFVVVLPETSRDQARMVAERLRQAVRETEFLRERGLSVRITASFGVATWPDDGLTPQALLQAADEAMYHAKRIGRDGVVTAR